MILSARKCGCPVHDQPQISRTSFSTSCSSSASSLRSCLSLLSSKSDDSCGCGSTSTIDEEPPSKPKIVSEIATKGLPYNEIETIFNNSRVVVRLQKEKPKEEFDPPCDCIEPQANGSQNDVASTRSDVVFQKSNHGCRTISVYPNPEQKAPEVELPTVNPEENPNIFVLKIKRKGEKHKLDLEFRSPRPWRKPKC